MSMAPTIEEEVSRRVRLALADHERAMSALRTELATAEFRAAVAEWAVAGVMSCNVRFCVAPEELNADKNRVLSMVEHFCKLAPAEMLNRAELAFRDHSALWELKASANPSSITYRDPMPSAVPPKESWPRPFKMKP